MKRVLLLVLIGIAAAPTGTVGQESGSTQARGMINSYCAGCHSTIESIGFAFEKYDGMGAARPLTNGKPTENGQAVVTATVLAARQPSAGSARDRLVRGVDGGEAR